MADYSLTVYYDEEDKVYWGHIDGHPTLMAHGDTFLECIAELELIATEHSNDTVALEASGR